MKSLWFAYAMVWVAVSVAVSVGLYFTRNIHCLWFLLIPLFVSFRQNEHTEEKDSNEERKK